MWPLLCALRVPGNFEAVDVYLNVICSIYREWAGVPLLPLKQRKGKETYLLLSS